MSTPTTTSDAAQAATADVLRIMEMIPHRYPFLLVDKVVDIRRGSPTFGRHVSAELTPGNGLMMLAPRGTAHGLVTLTDDTLVLYKVDAFFDLENDRALSWNDPALGIAWPETAGAAVSPKDAEAPLLADLPAYFEWEDA